jgi:hypothetical protein
MGKHAQKKGGGTQTNLNKFVGVSSSSDYDSSDSAYHLSDDDVPKAPNWWTRIKARDQLNDQLFALYNINDELKQWKARYMKKPPLNGPSPDLVFDPTTLDLQLADC